jgi:hypothetical protein
MTRLDGHMSDPKVAVFFYGSYMSPRVLEEANLSPETLAAATLEDFEIVIRPLANLVRSEGGCVYGVLAFATHAELERLYAHAREVLGGRYVPIPVVVRTRGGDHVPAFCYVAPALERRPASNDYIDRIVDAANRHGFPASYIVHLESFRP